MKRTTGKRLVKERKSAFWGCIYLNMGPIGLLDTVRHLVRVRQHLTSSYVAGATEIIARTRESGVPRL